MHVFPPEPYLLPVPEPPLVLGPPSGLTWKLTTASWLSLPVFRPSYWLRENILKHSSDLGPLLLHHPTLLPRNEG